MIAMTTLNAEKILPREKKLIISSHAINAVTTVNTVKVTAVTRAEKSCRWETSQKIAGAVMTVIALSAAFFGDTAAALVIVPPALAAVFSKEKILDFNIFGKRG